MTRHIATLAIFAIAGWGQTQTPLVVKQSAGSATGEVRLEERRTNGTNYIGLKAPDSVAADKTFVLPAADGTSGQALVTDGAGALSWSTVGGSSFPVCTSTTGNDTYACTVTGFTAYSTGYCIILNADTANTGAATVNISSVGAKSILRYGGSALSNNDILASSPVMICYDGTQFTLPPSASPGSGAFLDGGNSFGAAATLGTNDAQELRIETDATTRWKVTSAGMLLPNAADTYDIGELSASRVRGVYSQLLDTAKSGGTGDYVRTRKLELYDNTGSTTAASKWDLNVVMSGAGAGQESYMYMRDNGGAKVFQAERIRTGGAVDRTFWYTDLLPDTTGGQTLGSSSYRWGNAYVGILDASSSNTLVPNGTAALGASGNDWNRLWVGGVEASSFVRPQVDGGATSGSASKQWSATYTQALTASGATYLQTTGIGEASPSKGLLSVYGHNGYAYTPYNQVVSARFRTGANSAILFGTTVANTSGWTRGLYWTYQTEDLAFTRFKDDETAAPVVDMYVSASGLVGIGTASVTEELTVNGSIDVIGSGTIEIAGTTVIDASRNATVANLTVTGTCTGCSALPVSDTTAVVKGSADATRQMRFEVDGFTTATTRVLTPQNASYTIAGTDIGQTFTGAQTFNNTVTVNAQSWVTSGNSFVLDRATRGTNQKIYWTVGASTGVDGAWSVGTTPSGAASRWVVDHKGTEHLVIDESGLLTTTAGANFNGIVSTTTFNATGSPAYRVSGTTVIDASRNASIVGLTITGSVSGDILPSINNFYLLGNSSFRWSNTYTNNFNISGNTTGDFIPATTDLYTLGSNTNYWNMVRTTSIRTHGGNIQPATSLSGSLGASTGRWSKTWTQDLDITGTITPPSGSAFSGTKTVRAAGGGSDCTLTFSAGIMTGGTC